MKAVLFYHAAPDVLARAPAHLPGHQAWLDAFRRSGELLAVGPWADPREGAMAVFRTREAAERFVTDDPFVVHGVVVRHEIREWNEGLLPG